MSWKNTYTLKVETEFQKLTQVDILVGETGAEDIGRLPQSSPLPTEQGCSLSGLEPRWLTWKHYHGRGLVDVSELTGH